jgi:hypothetical protein
VGEVRLAFTADTAHNWAPPFDGVYAEARLYDDGRLVLSGDDDTYKARQFDTMEEAHAYLDLLVGVQPLDFNRDFDWREWPVA